ncbi:MAG: DUF2948 family protein [Kiloniellales bacterium]
MTAAPLKLRATDADDMRVIAAVLQDALVPLSDVVYQPRERRFVMVANRFCWESEGVEPANLAEPLSGPDGDDGDAAFHEGFQGGPLFERVNCGLRVEQVKAVRQRGIDPKDRDQILNLLTIDVVPPEPQGAITFVFSGGGAIRLEVAAIACHLEDIGEPWPTVWRPKHALDAADLEG